MTTVTSNAYVGVAGHSEIFDAPSSVNLYINAGDGSDFLFAYSENDYLIGGLGRDLIRALSGDDVIFGDRYATDELQNADPHLAADADAIFGGAGFDTIYAGGGNNFVDGGSDDDTITGGAGNEMLQGGTGNDTIYGLAGNDSIFGGSDSAEGQNSFLDANFGVLSFAFNGITDAEQAGTRDPKTSVVSVPINTGNDYLDGGDGNDYIDGQDGADIMIGGKGNDTIVVDNVGDKVVEEVGGGNDTVRTSISYTLARGVEVETLSTTDALTTATINLTGNEFKQTLIGNDGNNILTGGAGADRLDGRSGSDTASYANATTGVTANLKFSSGNTGDAAGDTYFSIENLTGSSRADTLVGNDVANRILGGAGDDTISGLAGDDRISGGLGSDTLSGGAGRDTFIFDAALDATNIDRILDYTVVDDIIWLDDDVFTQVGAVGDLAEDAFWTGTAANDETDRIIYNKTTGALLYDADGTGAIAAVQFATIRANLAITAAEFDIVA